MEFNIQSFYQMKTGYDMKEHVKITVWLNAHTENEVNIKQNILS